MVQGRCRTTALIMATCSAWVELNDHAWYRYRYRSRGRCRIGKRFQTRIQYS